MVQDTNEMLGNTNIIMQIKNQEGEELEEIYEENKEDTKEEEEEEEEN